MAPRKEKLLKLAGLFYEHLIKPDPERVKDTGALSPTKSLRHKATREAFAFARQLGNGRFFTEAIVRDTLKIMAATPMKYDLEMPSTPGFSIECWVKEEAAILHKLLKRARRSTAMGDTVETQPWDINSWSAHLDPAEAS